MSADIVKVVALAWGLAAGTAALAQDRPSEEALFGAPADAGTPAPEAPPAPAAEVPAGQPAAEGQASESRPSEEAIFDAPSNADVETPQTRPPGDDSPQSRDAELLSGPAAVNRFESEEEKSDPLKLGGFVYLRSIFSRAEGQPPKNVAVSTPSLLDVYLDGRPNDRVRGFVLGRLTYDGVYDPNQPNPYAAVPGLTVPARANPSIALDQLWIRFDIARAVFLTIGKQHVKWGVASFWNPTDYLTPERLDPLALYDQRLGTNMIKLHVPWEARGWNFYVMGLFDNAGPANLLGEIGGAARAEVVLGNTEIGADAVVVRGRRPRYGFDLSTALGPFDVYGELALRSGRDFRPWRPVGQIDPDQALTAAFEQYTFKNAVVQTSVGVRYSFNYTESNVLSLGAEYFFNQAGVSDPVVYPWLIYQSQFLPFYVGKHYGGLIATSQGLPFGLTNMGLTLVNLGNFSDMSFVSRLLWNMRILSYLQVEAYTAYHYGTKGGEFRFGLDLPPLPLGPGQFTPPIFIPAPQWELGAGVRVNL